MTGDDRGPPGDDLPTAVDERLASLLETISAFAALDFSRPAEIGPAGNTLDAVAAGINMLGEEVEFATHDLEERVAERTQKLEVITRALQTEIDERRRNEAAVRDAREMLRERLTEVEQLNDEIMQLTELTNLLQVCASRKEAFDVLAQAGPKLFPDAEGAVYTFDAAHDTVELVASWDGFDPPAAFDRGDCWALRRGKLHVAIGNGGMRCAHTPTDRADDQLCMPLIAQGEVLGLIHLRCLSDTDGSEGTHPSGHERRAVAAAVLMMDIDRFKTFNDTHGHEAGDTTLRRVAATLRKQVRVEDVVCRYGGEEFIVVVAGVDTTEATNRAERLRTEISNIALDWQGQPLGTITASFGVATYPAHATSIDDLIRAADTALYDAKESGRNRVAIYASSSEAA